MRTEIFLVFLLFSQLHGFCYKTFGRIDKTVSGRLIPVCEFNGLDILDGSTFSTAACTECVCNQGTLACCGYGVNGPKVEAPPGCKTVADGCEVLIVKQYDETVDCYTGQPISGGVPQIEPFIGGVTGTNYEMTNQVMDMTKGSAGGLPIDMNMLTTDLSQQMLGSPEQTNSIFDAMFGQNTMISPEAGSLAIQTDTGVTSPVATNMVAGVASVGSTNNVANDIASNNVSVDAGSSVATEVNNTVNGASIVEVQSTVPPRPPVTFSTLPPTMKGILDRSMKQNSNTGVKIEKNSMWDSVMNQIVPPNPFLIRGAPIDMGMLDMFRNSGNVAQPADPRSRIDMVTPPPSNPNSLADMFFLSKFADFPGF